MEKEDTNKNKKEDDEITLDLSKLTFWKKGKSEKAKSEDKPETHKHEDNSEKRTHTTEQTQKEHKQAQKDEKTHSEKEKKHDKKESKEVKKSEDDEDISFDIHKTLNFFKKYAAVFLILIPVILMIWFRSYPMSIPAADDWATSSVQNYYRGMIDQQVGQQYPNLPTENRAQLVEEEFQKFLATNQAQVDQQIQQTAAAFRAQLQDENGYTYLADIDSYIWLRYAQNIREYGFTGDEYLTGKELEEKTMDTSKNWNLDPDKKYNYDNHMFAPIGSISNPTLHPFVIAYTYTIIKPFSPKLTLMQASFLVPIIMSLISIIAAFFIGRKVAGNAGGFFAAMIIAIHPFFISRTYGSDTDVYNVLFPLLIVWFFIEAFDAKDAKKGIIFAGIAGFFTGLFSFVWLYWYVFDFVLAAMGIYLLYYIFVHWKGFDKLKETFSHPSIKKIFLVTLVYIIISGIFVTLFAGFSVFTGGFTAPLGFVSIKDSARADLWPNVYTTVAELNDANWDSVVGSIGGKYLFFISIIGILLTFLKKDEHGKPDMKFVFLFTIWYIATIYASFKGVRFVLLLVPAFAIGIGAAAGIGYYYLSDWFSKSFSMSRKIVGASIFILFFIIIFISPGGLVVAARDTSKNALPLVDDAWWDSLTVIKQQSQQNAIINSWWDFGHHFKYIADRAVTFDGASQNIPQAHWIGKVLLTDDEDQAIGILRMLDCGANTAFEKVYEVIKDTDKSVDIVYKIIVMDRSSAKEYLLTQGLTDAQAEDVLKRTHCNPPEDYFITSEDMVGKSGVWAHFGSWNFDKANIWINTKGKSKDETIKFILDNTNYSREQAEKMYYELSAIKAETEANAWIAPWPSYASGAIGCGKLTNSTRLNCDNGIGIDIATHETFVPTQQGVKSLDAVTYYDENDQMREVTAANNTMGLAANLMQTGPESYAIILMQNPLQKSMFHRLFYNSGMGLKHFDKISEKRSINGQNIIVWKVNWEGKKEEQKTEEIPEPVISIS